MEMTKELINKIKTAAEDYEYEYDYFAVRVQEVPFELGEMNHVSHVWVDGEETDEELDGVCGIKLSALERIVKSGVTYYGDHVALICGNKAEGGEDDGELILKDAVVVEIAA